VVLVALVAQVVAKKVVAAAADYLLVVLEAPAAAEAVALSALAQRRVLPLLVVMEVVEQVPVVGVQLI
jgi:hypothetical protein